MFAVNQNFRSRRWIIITINIKKILRHFHSSQSTTLNFYYIAKHWNSETSITITKHTFLPYNQLGNGIHYHLWKVLFTAHERLNMLKLGFLTVNVLNGYCFNTLSKMHIFYFMLKIFINMQLISLWIIANTCY